jgi:hypothetical protein
MSCEQLATPGLSPIDSAGEGGNGNIYFSKWRPSGNIKEHQSSQWKKINQH